MSENEQEMIEEFIENKKSHEEQLTIDAAKAILDCELRKKDIAQDIKEIKQQAKDEGVLIGQVMKAVKAIKAELKADVLEKKEQESMYKLLFEDSDVRFKIESLVSSS